MRRTLITSAVLAVSACSRFGALAPGDVLTKCWDAKRVGSTNQFTIHVEGLTGFGEEGGTFARTPKCPSQILLIGFQEGRARQKLDELGNRADNPMSIGFKADGTVVIVPGGDQTHVKVEFVYVKSTASMPREWIRAFYRTFRL